jgi:hypothetical protein
VPGAGDRHIKVVHWSDVSWNWMLLLLLLLPGAVRERTEVAKGYLLLTGMLTVVVNCCDRNQLIEKKNSICACRFE